jgi:hypothetical protein
MLKIESNNKYLDMYIMPTDDQTAAVVPTTEILCISNSTQSMGSDQHNISIMNQPLEI